MNDPIISIQQRLERMAGSVDTLFGGSQVASACQDRIQRGRRDVEEIAANKGVWGVLVSVIGHKNAGKSTLCRWLISDDGQRERVRAGLERDGGTRSVTWIGPEPPPPGPDSGRPEQWIEVAGSGLADLGRSYSLVDVPGYNDSDPVAERASRNALSRAGVVVLASNLELWEDDSALHYLRESDGVRILPVAMVDPALEGNPGVQRNLKNWRDRIQAHCPRSEVREPLALPFLLHLTDDDVRRRATNGAIKRFHESLAECVSADPVDPAALALTRLDRVRREVAAEIAPLVERIRPFHRDLVAKEKVAANDFLDELLGTSEQVFPAVRLKLMMRLVNRCPLFLFPFRSFLSLLTLVAGAWDRLMLGMLGSVPSLVLAAVQSARNSVQLAKKREANLEALERRAKVVAVDTIGPAQAGFRRAVAGSLPPGARGRHLPEAVFSVSGIDEAGAIASECLERAINQHSVKGGWCLVFGLVSLAAWVGMAVGPVWSVYQQFFQSWRDTLGPEHQVQWTSYPLPSFSFIFSTAMLVFAPAFALAMAALFLSVSTRRVRRCIEAVFTESRARLKQAISSGRIVIGIADDRIRESYEVLLEEFGAVTDADPDDHPG